MKRRVVFTIAAILWMMVIFLFSAKPADESQKMSLSAGHMVGRIFVSDYEEWSLKRQTEFAEGIDYPVRKAAHATEYMVLGLLLTGMYGSYGLTGKKNLAAGFVTGTLYACSDELHQLFVPGRSCQITDVMIDSAGVAAGIILWTAVSAVAYKRINKKQQV